MLPHDIKSKFLHASKVFNSPMCDQASKYLTILDGHEHFIVRQYKRFPLAYEHDVILYKASIEDQVLEVARRMTNHTTSFVARLSVSNSFMFFIDPTKHCTDTYIIKHRWIEMLNDALVGSIDIMASFARQF